MDLFGLVGGGIVKGVEEVKRKVEESWKRKGVMEFYWLDAALLHITLRRVLECDDALRELGKTLFWPGEDDVGRRQVEKALKAMEEAKRCNIVKVRREGNLIFKYKYPGLRVEVDDEVVFGIGRACCKAIALHEMGIIALSDEHLRIVRRIWDRVHLYHKRKMAGIKAYWSSKGYKLKCDIPDYRERKYHEESKFVYELP